MTNPLIMFPDAFERVWQVCEEALAGGKHKEGDWRTLGVAGNVDHAVTHIREFIFKAEDEDHLANLACRTLMALQLREEAKKVKS